MNQRTVLPLLIVLAMPGCSAPSADIPSLAIRPAERVDPRIPVERPLNDRPADPALLSRVAALVADARAGEARFEAAIATARLAAESAGPPQSEGWIVAQEALSGAVEARGAAAVALAAIDALEASLLAEQGGLAPADLAAIEDAAGVVGAIDQRQSAAIDSVQAQLGS